MRRDKDGNVIITDEGEGLRELDPRIPTENIGHPVHTWRSKAFELFHVSERRRQIIRKLVKGCAKAKSAGCDWRGF